MTPTVVIEFSVLRKTLKHIAKPIHTMSYHKYLRIIDLIGHCMFAILLPGKWWYQFIPDAMFVLCMMISIVKTKKLTPPEFSMKNSTLLKLHQFSHTIYLPVLTLFIGWRLCLHCLVHVIWDQYTHQESWQKRSLWKILQ